MSANPNQSEPARTRYFVHAEHDPSVFVRIMGLFTQRDLIPLHAACHVRERDGRRWLEIDIESEGLEEVHARHLAARIEQFFPVISVAFDHGLSAAALPRHRAA